MKQAVQTKNAKMFLPPMVFFSGHISRKLKHKQKVTFHYETQENHKRLDQHFEVSSLKARDGKMSWSS